MILIGTGQGDALRPFRAAGITGVARTGAASGRVGVAHQLRDRLGLVILVTVLAAATARGSTRRKLAHRSVPRSTPAR
jgi:hypothetical protein